jgi:hypothetical protein
MQCAPNALQQQQLSSKRQMLSSDAMLVDELQHVHNGALQLKQQHELLSFLNHISTDVVTNELPRVHSDALQLKQQAQPPLQPPVFIGVPSVFIGQLQHLHNYTVQLWQPHKAISPITHRRMSH